MESLYTSFFIAIMFQNLEYTVTEISSREQIFIGHKHLAFEHKHLAFEQNDTRI